MKTSCCAQSSGIIPLMRDGYLRIARMRQANLHGRVRRAVMAVMGEAVRVESQKCAPTE